MTTITPFHYLTERSHELGQRGGGMRNGRYPRAGNRTCL